jgi:hypothetical protein
MRSKKVAGIVALVIAVVALVVIAFRLTSAHRSSLLSEERTSNAISSAQLDELRMRAKQGDDSAKLELHLFLGDTEEGKAMFEAAVRNEYGPAVAVALQRAISEKNSSAYATQYDRAERTSRAGSLATSIALASCKWSGECGKASLVEAYKWAALAAHISSRMPSKGIGVEEERRRIEPLLDETKRKEIEKEVEGMWRNPAFRPQP